MASIRKEKRRSPAEFEKAYEMRGVEKPPALKGDHLNLHVYSCR